MASSQPGPLVVSRPRILCVDDEPMLLRGLTATLRKRFEVISAPDGATALEILAHAGGFPIVVSDYRMPGMNGAVFLGAVRARFPKAVRILLTGAGAEGEDVTADPDLVFRLLTKPCRRETLVSTLDEAMERWRKGPPTAGA